MPQSTHNKRNTSTPTGQEPHKQATNKQTNKQTNNQQRDKPPTNQQDNTTSTIRQRLRRQGQGQQRPKRKQQKKFKRTKPHGVIMRFSMNSCTNNVPVLFCSCFGVHSMLPSWPCPCSKPSHQQRTSTDTIPNTTTTDMQCNWLPYQLNICPNHTAQESSITVNQQPRAKQPTKATHQQQTTNINQ